MPSAALVEWKGPRTARIEELFTAHRKIGGTGVGRRYNTEQLNWALILRLAGEFQGFARDLHDEAVDFFVLRVGALNVTLSGVVEDLLTDRRKLDKGNANPDNMAEDFGRMGIKLGPDLRARGRRTSAWWATLTTMNKARNAIAHDDQRKMAELVQDGWPLSRLDTIRKFHRAASGTAAQMDIVVAESLHRLFGEGRPW